MVGEDTPEQRTDSEYLCAQCGKSLNDPKNCGFPYEGEWFCSGWCADVVAGFWDAGEQVSDYNAQLSEDYFP